MTETPERLDKPGPNVATMLSPRYVIVMLAGPHAGESWRKIIEWKCGEVRNVGRTFWGYGGTPCHPTHQVQPFAKEHAPDRIDVAFIETKSDPRNSPTAPTEYSADGRTWHPIPEGIKTSGGKYALVLDALDVCDDSIDLGQYQVAVGGHRGTPAIEYLRGHVDKACLVRSEASEASAERRVALRGRLAPPWAVFLREAVEVSSAGCLNDSAD